MSRWVRATAIAGLSILSWTYAASAETLRCQSVNGNVNCAGSGGVSCQTVDGKKVCTSGNGDIVQSFGSGSPSNAPNQHSKDSMTDDDRDPDDSPAAAGPRQHVERHGPNGRTLLLDRDGTQLHLRTDRQSIDRQ